MRIVITGGNGFLGSNTARRFLKDNHEVMILSNNSDNIQDIIERVKYCKLDVENFTQIEHSIKSFSPEVLIHCAWSGGNNYVDVDNDSQFYNNFSLGVKLISCLKSTDKRVRFMGFGSFSEYGNLLDRAKEEDLENPTNMYGLSKYMFKMYSKLICQQNSIDWTWIRPCYVFGRGDVKTRLIPKLIEKFSTNERVELNECNSIVDYIHVDDFCEMLYELIISNQSGVFNICSGNEYIVRDIVESLKEITGSASEIVYNKELNRKTSTYVCGNNKKILRVVKHRLSSTLKEDLIKTVYEKDYVRD